MAGVQSKCGEALTNQVLLIMVTLASTFLNNNHLYFSFTFDFGATSVLLESAVTLAIPSCTVLFSLHLSLEINSLSLTVS